ncbi:MAG: hypothetical protein LBO73_01960 [Holosporaceae bacterium]|nr:hypothetical protein [Holosporaceae bacterium]
MTKSLFTVTALYILMILLILEAFVLENRILILMLVVSELLVYFRIFHSTFAPEKNIKIMSSEITPKAFRLAAYCAISAITLTVNYLLLRTNICQDNNLSFRIYFCIHIIFAIFTDPIIIYLNKDEAAKEKLKAYYTPLLSVSGIVLFTAIIAAIIFGPKLLEPLIAFITG